MARLAHIVVPGLPYHVTQRGNGRQRTFFGAEDYAFYRDYLADHCQAAGVEVWAWCLMPNHVHIILVPSDPDGLRRALAPTHRRYAGHVQAREKRTGHFWQGRYGAVAMDEAHLLYAVRYVSLNPVRAGLVERAQDWPWASTRARLFGLEDGITSLTPLRQPIVNFSDLLDDETDEAMFNRIRRAETVGRPLGDDAFIDRIAILTGREVRPGKRGAKPKEG
ncbi:transposase [Labrys sp. KB_33_2]|uniref:transposase n=1 Tax=Labrys sp. KB_33_2 TaxID=3237479 RepID=UPI003F939271